jgi:hypothetical protein
MHQPPDRSLHWQPGFPVDAKLTLAALRRGHHDPTHRVEPDGTLWRAALTGSGPVTYRIRQQGLKELHIDAWGPGAAQLIDNIPTELGATDHPELFHPDHPVLQQALHARPGLRVPRTGRIFEALVPAIIEQRVVGLDAKAAFTRLVRANGTRPPGPAPDGMRVPPTPKAWTSSPSWEWRRAGVDLHRSRTLIQATHHAVRLEQTSDEPHRSYTLLAKLPGIGPCTAAQVGHRALGDADALPLGDYHLGRMTGTALLGHPLGETRLMPSMNPSAPIATVSSA